MSWENELEPDDRRIWDEFVRSAREDAASKISESAFVMSLVPRGETDIKFAVELGLSIMFDKPLLIVVAPGTPIPARLERVADVICVADIDTAEGRDAVALAVKEMAEE